MPGSRNDNITVAMQPHRVAKVARKYLDPPCSPVSIPGVYRSLLTADDVAGFDALDLIATRKGQFIGGDWESSFPDCPGAGNPGVADALLHFLLGPKQMQRLSGPMSKGAIEARSEELAASFFREYPIETFLRVPSDPPRRSAAAAAAPAARPRAAAKRSPAQQGGCCAARQQAPANDAPAASGEVDEEEQMFTAFDEDGSDSLDVGELRDMIWCMAPAVEWSHKLFEARSPGHPASTYQPRCSA